MVKDIWSPLCPLIFCFPPVAPVLKGSAECGQEDPYKPGGAQEAQMHNMRRGLPSATFPLYFCFLKCYR